jgi:hemerythrin-like domain-containing protein
MDYRRRKFLEAAILGGGLALIGCTKKEEEAEVTPGEDLMQEHGVVERVLLIYDEAARRIEQREALDLGVLVSACGVVRRFVQDYHEKSEERFVFPKLEGANRLRDLVATLRRQHQRGRELTDAIERLARGGSASPELAQAMRSFERMYRPHAAREDTELFPAYRELLSDSEYRELGEKFEEEEHQRFGEHGFEKIVAEVGRLEAALAIGDLAKFTP